METSGCAIILPAPQIVANVCVVTGPAERIGDGIKKVMDVQSSYLISSMPIFKAHPTSLVGGEAHARALARLWSKNSDLTNIEMEAKTEFHIPTSSSELRKVEIRIVARSPESMNQAKAAFKTLVESYPPGRIDGLQIDPICQTAIIGKDGRGLKQLQDKYGVSVLIGDAKKEFADEVFLVCEDANIPIPQMKEKLHEVKELLEAQAKAVGEISQETLNIDTKFHDVISNGTTLRALSQGIVSVDINEVEEGKTREDLVLTIRGAQADVNATKKKISAWVEENEDSEELGKQHVITFDYPVQFSAMLIGSKGANVNKLHDELGVDIKLKEGKAEIKGLKINAEVARRKLNEQIKQMEDNTTLWIKVPPEHHRSIIGSQRKYVRRLEEKYGVRIFFPKSRDDQEANDGSFDPGAQRYNRQLAPNEVMVKGGKKGCAETKSEIEELLKYEIEHGQTASVIIAARSIKGLFTTYSKEFKRIREESGVRIEIPNDSDSPPDAMLEIKIRGTKEEVGDAKKDLSKIVSDLEHLTVQRISVDKKYHRSLIGTGGAMLKEIVEKAGGPKDRSAQARMVRFPNTDSADDVIKIEGNRAVVEKIIEQINQIVEGKKDQVQEVVDIAPDKYARLIGRGGAVRQGIEARFRVTIDIPRQNHGSSTPTPSGVTLLGLPADVEAAKAHILEFTKEVEGETVIVPRNLHHAVTDEGLFIKRLRTDLRVTVDYNSASLPLRPNPPQKPPTTNSTALPLITDTNHDETRAFSWDVIDLPTTSEGDSGEEDIAWVLRSPVAENIQKAKDLLQKQIDQVKRQTHVGYLTLPDQTSYKYVVGRQGSQVNRIRNETGCRVMVPRESGDGESIVITGSKEGVEKAKEIIMELVQGGGDGREREGERERRPPREWGGGDRGGRRGGRRGGD